MPPNRQRYSVETLIVAFILFDNSNDGYQFDSIQRYNLKYILLSNFKLRGSFWIINTTGSNDLLSVTYVMHGERVLKIKGLLCL